MIILFLYDTKEGINVDLKEKVRALPSVPGVYLMKDSLGGIIYVGKSKNLKNRVGSYFQMNILFILVHIQIRMLQKKLFNA